MKVVYTHRTQGRGAEGAHVAGMVEAFRQLGHEVVVDCMPGCDPTAPWTEGPPSAATRSWRARVAAAAPQWLFGLIELLYNAPLAMRLLGVLLRERPALVYERYSLCTLAPVLLCRWLRVPHVLEINDSVVIERSRPLALVRCAVAIERFVLRRTSLGITISERFLSQLKDSTPPPLPAFLVCPNAVSDARFLRRKGLSDDARAALRSRHGLLPGPVLGSAGQFVAWHGLPEFVEAAASLIKEHGLQLLFIGDGPTREETLAAARRHGVDGRVTFTGMLPHAQIPDHLELLDVAVIPRSNMHGSPMKLMEFMAMGLPVVAPALPPVLEVVQDGVTAYLFPPGDLPAMMKALQACLQEPTRARAVGAAARHHVALHLTWNVHARHVLDHLGLGATA